MRHHITSLSPTWSFSRRRVCHSCLWITFRPLLSHVKESVQRSQSSCSFPNMGKFIFCFISGRLLRWAASFSCCSCAWIIPDLCVCFFLKPWGEFHLVPPWWGILSWPHSLCSAETQTRAFRSLGGPDGLGNASSLRTQAHPWTPTHGLQHAVPHVGLRDRRCGLSDHSWKQSSQIKKS